MDAYKKIRKTADILGYLSIVFIILAVFFFAMHYEYGKEVDKLNLVINIEEEIPIVRLYTVDNNQTIAVWKNNIDVKIFYEASTPVIRAFEIAKKNPPSYKSEYEWEKYNDIVKNYVFYGDVVIILFLLALFSIFTSIYLDVTSRRLIWTG